jgi:serine/threonine-protein kinase RsbW
MTLVNPSHRGQGIARMVAAGLAEQAVALNLCGLHDYPVTVHAATQRIAKGYGVDTGLLLANMPADVSFTSMDATSGGRSSSLIRWLPFGRAPKREVFLPERYRRRIVSLYAAAKLERTLGGSRRPTISTSALETITDDRRGILRLRVTRIGVDLRPLVAAAHETGFIVAQIDLPLSDPGTPAATRELRTLGYSFAGLLPEYRDGDVLRLQWLSPKAGESAAAVLSSTATRAIEAFVLEDRLGLGSG